MEKAREQIIELVQRFRRNLDDYKRGDYKETQLRVEFIDPFFEALGWDVRNVRGYAEQYKDVVHEDAIKVSGATKAPDYCFRIGGVRKFFLEAKKPSVHIKGEPNPAFQLRRYAWSANLPLSILTDFEEFAVYDCRQRPAQTDKASVGRIAFYTFEEYPDRFEEIYSVFAKESVLKGSFDRYIQETKGKRGTSEVDAEFLKEIEAWRDALARSIALRNPALSVHELNFAVQRTIDRIIFLRMCEDRGIEDYGRLLALTAGPQIYPRLCELYRQADEKYNSDLFDFRADSLTRTLTIDDKVLNSILAGLYYPQSPYEFSVIPPEILGNVYEQFLGKVIRLTPGHRAKVEEKPEVKKAGGVYYTPTYIVDYIVKQTVGKLTEGKTPKQISKLRILDPACGSGSFLLGAYQCLLDYHLQWYMANDPARHAQGRQPAIYQAPTPGGPSPASGGGVREGVWRLTTAEKKRILLDNIYGVDIDRQAVEVTKLSLLLKVLEGENQETLRQQLALWRERALPDLGSNIKCGNSLIGPDYFEGQLMPDEEEMRRVNPFDWEAEFPEIMKAGGFDCVIGNPPYVRVDYLDELWKDYFKEAFKTSRGKYDLYYLFLEKSLSLLKEFGRMGWIVPNKFCSATSAKELRDLLHRNSSKIEINSVSLLDVFSKVANYPVLLILEKSVRRAKSYLKMTRTIDKSKLVDTEWTLCLSSDEIDGIPDRIFPVNANQDLLNLYLRLADKTKPFGLFARISEGFRIPAQLEKEAGEEHIVKQYQFSRFSPVAKGSYVTMEERRKVISDTSVRFLDSLKPKLLFAEDALRIEATLDLEKSLCQGGVYFAVIESDPNNLKLLYYLLGLLNSKLLSTLYKTLFGGMHMGGGYLRFRTNFLSQLPIRTINFSDPADVARHDKMVALVERMLELHKKQAEAKTQADRELYRRQIEATDKEIDKLVYELYGLTEEEIKIVESA
ncbi:MAG: Eco57I restriction-modification methylase domain-containing protein [Anaerolineae bacterium]